MNYYRHTIFKVHKVLCYYCKDFKTMYFTLLHKCVKTKSFNLEKDKTTYFAYNSKNCFFKFKHIKTAHRKVLK